MFQIQSHFDNNTHNLLNNFDNHFYDTLHTEGGRT